MQAILIFPPNWATAVTGPHLALPLLAGAARAAGWAAESWDLTAEYSRKLVAEPTLDEIGSRALSGDFDGLDSLYFRWEDALRTSVEAPEGREFGLLSGYPLRRYTGLPLADVVGEVDSAGTPYTRFLRDNVYPRLAAENPDVVGVTIASSHQVVPAIEVIKLVRHALPHAFVVLGGNVVTRLREAPAFEALRRLVDHIVVFQGEAAFRRILETVERLGSERARECLPTVAGDELIQSEDWPQPSFEGLLIGESPTTAVLPYVSTRGCYWGKCHFCAIPAGWARGGYGGSAPAESVARQLLCIAADTGISRFKFVDESLPPAKVRPLARLLAASASGIEWEAYARLEPAWEDVSLLEEAFAGGLRKLYFGLEQAPSTDRKVLNKNDRGDPMRIILACNAVGIKVHLFCMVGHPHSTAADAHATTRFLIDHEWLIDTADLVGFRLDRGTTVRGVRPAFEKVADWATSFPFVPTEAGVLDQAAVHDLECTCQEAIWESVPRLLHPLYRLVGPWQRAPHELAPASKASRVPMPATHL